MSLRLVITLLLFGCGTCQHSRPYINYKLVEITAKTEHLLTVLIDNIHEDVDVLSRDGTTHSIAAIVKPIQFHPLVSTIERYNGTFRILEENLQESVDKEFQRIKLRLRKREILPLGRAIRTFQTLSEIYAFQNRIVKACSGEMNVKKKTIGFSFYQRPINIIQISSKTANRNKKTIFIESGVHAREWLSPATANYIIYQLACRSENAYLTKLFNWEILTIANPDGYRFTFQGDRYWRKTRQPNPGSSCIGTDLNRNFKTGYGRRGSSRDPCSNIYRGRSANSAPEAKALSNYILANKGRIFAYISMHTSGQYMLLPWAYKRNQIPDYKRMVSLSQKAAAATGYRFKIGSCYKILYPAAGTTFDFAREQGKISRSFTWELMGRGFAPPEILVPAYTSAIWKGVKALTTAEDLGTSTPAKSNIFLIYAQHYLKLNRPIPEYVQVMLDMFGK